MSRPRASLRRLGRQEHGYSVTELVTVMAIMGTVLAGITALFVQGTTAELDLNRRYQAQENARLALGRLRREVQCANAITPSGAATSVTFTLPASCSIATGSITWCALSVGGSATRHKLYRSTASPCGDAADRVYADYLSTATVFNHTVQSTQSLGKVAVTLPVDLDPTKPGQYQLDDTLVMRNSRRSCITGSPSPPC